MLRQAKLLRLFPLWVLGPLLPGFGLLLWTRDIADLQDVLWISMEIAFVGLVLAVITWLGLRRASKLALGASSLKEAQSI
jgi:hypothetical protein